MKATVPAFKDIVYAEKFYFDTKDRYSDLSVTV